MVFICFVLDLESFESVRVIAIKQCLLRLGNLCALREVRTKTPVPRTSIAVCYTRWDDVLGMLELHVIYKPEDHFDLRDFHHKVSGIPAVGPSTSKSRKLSTVSQRYFQVSCLSELFKSEDGLVSWVTRDENKKIVMLSGQFIENSCTLSEIISEAAAQLVSFEFLQIEQAHYSKTGSQQREVPLSATTLNFKKCISKFLNCTFRSLNWDSWTLPYLAKKWFEEIISDLDGPVEVALQFSEEIAPGVSRVFCSFQAAILQLVQTLKPCQTCRCHGEAMDGTERTHATAEVAICPVTGQKLVADDCVADGILIGSESVLSFPSFKTPLLLPPDTRKSGAPPISFRVVRCVAQNTVDEGLCFGIPHNVLPAGSFRTDKIFNDPVSLEQNKQFFVAVLQQLHSSNCGLLCTSTMEMDTRTESSFMNFYFLIPAENQCSFVAKRIAAEEDLRPADSREAATPQPIFSDEITTSVSKWFSKMGVHSYCPLMLERGCHSKLAWLAKESLLFRPTKPPGTAEVLLKHLQGPQSPESVLVPEPIQSSQHPEEWGGKTGGPAEYVQYAEGIGELERTQSTSERLAVETQLSALDPYEFDIQKATHIPTTQGPSRSQKIVTQHRAGAKKLSLPVRITPKPQQATQAEIITSQLNVPSEDPKTAVKEPLVRRFRKRRYRQD